MEEKFVINGEKPLSGEIEVRGAKNAAFPILAATLLTKKECVISNLPLIEDIFRMVEILKSMGSKVSWVSERTLKIKNSQVDPAKIKDDIICLLRGSVLFLGPLLARFGKVCKFPQPGGCVIGARPIDVHLDSFKQMGIGIKEQSGKYTLEAGKMKDGVRQVILNELSVTATENLMLLASLTP